MLFRGQQRRLSEGEEECQICKEGGIGACLQDQVQFRYPGRRLTEEAVAEIRARAEAKRAKRERSEADAIDKVEAKMREKAERKRKSRGAKTETVERARDWAEA